MTTAHSTRRRALAGSLALAAAALLAGCGDDPPQRDASGAITQSGETRLLKLRTGDCVANLDESLDNPDGGNNGVPKVKAVNCSQPHDAELLLVAGPGGRDWPGDAAVDLDVDRGRDRLQARLVRIKIAVGQLTLFTFRPTQDRWEFEHQHASLFLTLYDKQLRGHAPR